MTPQSPLLSIAPTGQLVCLLNELAALVARLDDGHYRGVRASDRESAPLPPAAASTTSRRWRAGSKAARSTTTNESAALRSKATDTQRRPKSSVSLAYWKTWPGTHPTLPSG